MVACVRSERLSHFVHYRYERDNRPSPSLPQRPFQGMSLQPQLSQVIYHTIHMRQYSWIFFFFLQQFIFQERQHYIIQTECVGFNVWARIALKVLQLRMIYVGYIFCDLNMRYLCRHSCVCLNSSTLDMIWTVEHTVCPI